MILVRYAELGLKSRGVRKFFERVLVNNMMTLLAKERVEALIEVDQGRIFVETDRSKEALKILSRVFGIASISPAIKVGSSMVEMQRAAAEFSKPLIKLGDGFAIRARREGDHPYTSQDVGREVGSAVYLANQEKGIHVDLTDPEVEIFVEVRRKHAYIFSRYIPGPGGLPMGSQGRAVALVQEERDALAAWLIMKRGCKVIVVSEGSDLPLAILEKWDPNLKVVKEISLEEAARRNKALAVVFSYGIVEFDKIKETRMNIPEFYPLIGMDGQEIELRLEAIKKASSN